MDKLQQDIRDLAAAVETLAAALLTAKEDRAGSLALLRAAQSMAAAIRTGETILEKEERPNA